MNLVTNALAAKIRQAMDDQHLSFAAAAEKCGIGHGVLTNILYGRTRRPEPETLDCIAQGLGFSYRELALAAYGVITDNHPVPA